MNKQEILVQLLKDFYPFVKKELGFNKPIKLFLRNDSENANNPLGKTAFYDPNELKIFLFHNNRHPKDILRSFAHELIHHNQNCEDRLHHDSENIDEDGKLYELEAEANKGGILLRMWERELEKNNKSDYYNQLMKAEGELMEEQDSDEPNPWAICGKSVGKPKKKNKKGKYERCVLSVKKQHGIKKESLTKKGDIMSENKDFERSLEDTTESDTIKDHYTKRAERVFEKLTDKWKTKKEKQND